MERRKKTRRKINFFLPHYTLFVYTVQCVQCTHIAIIFPFNGSHSRILDCARANTHRRYNDTPHLRIYCSMVHDFVFVLFFCIVIIPCVRMSSTAHLQLAAAFVNKNSKRISYCTFDPIPCSISGSRFNLYISSYLSIEPMCSILPLFLINF